MANPEHLKILGKGVDVWNSWRMSDPDTRPDLSAADLSAADLRGANFSEADLTAAEIYHPITVNRKTRVTGARIPKNIANHFSKAVGFSKAIITDKSPPSRSAPTTEKDPAPGPAELSQLTSQLNKITGRLSRLEDQPHPPDLSAKVAELEDQLSSTAATVGKIAEIEDSANAANAKLSEIESDLQSVKDISKLVGEYESLPEKAAALERTIEQARGELASWREQAQGELNNLTEPIRTEFKDLAERYASLPEELTALLDQLSKARQQLTADQENTKTELENLRQTQQSELRQKFETWKKEVAATTKSVQAAIAQADSHLEWDKISERFGRQAYWWSGAAFGFTIFLVVAAFVVLTEVPNIAPQDLSAEEWLKSLRPAILVAIPSSVLIYLVRTCVRLALSAFHLRRDADERHMLSKLYIGLIKDASVGEEARTIVLQALFTRSDTGLLQKDSAGATMPGQLAALLSGRGKGK